KVSGGAAPIILGLFLKLENADKLKSEVANMTAGDRSSALDAMALHVIPPYLGIIVVLLALAFWVYKSGLPEIDTDEEDAEVAASNSGKTSVFNFPHVILGVFTMFLYVGVEVIAGDSIISYGSSQGIPLTTAKFFTTGTMIAMVVGYIVGIICI